MNFKEQQKLALDVGASVWISAVAGGGKTTLVINRIIKLLIIGAKPSEIVVITYTNEAIKEIKKRIELRIKSWHDNEENLLKDLEFFGVNVSRETQECENNDFGINKTCEKSCFDEPKNKSDNAKSNNSGCFKTNVSRETLKNFYSDKVHQQINISTFHSFCLKIINKFSSELNFDKKNLKILNTMQIQTIISNLLDELFHVKHSNAELIDLKENESRKKDYISENNESNVSRETLSCNLEGGSKYNFDKFYLKKIILEIISKSNEFLKYNVSRETSAYPDSQYSEIFFCIERLEKLHNVLFKEKNKEKNIEIILNKINEIMFHVKQNEKLTDEKSVSINLDNIIQEYIDIFFTQKLEARKTLLKSLEKNNVSRETLNLIHYECDLLLKYIDCTNTIKNFENSNELLSILAEIFKMYNKLKNEKNYLDYSDIIDKCLFLISESPYAQYALYSIFNECKYLILDEAQDMSQKQWEIIKLITEEFYSGQYSNDEMFHVKHNSDISENNFYPREALVPNIFVVGDPKQSIFGFQGADVKFFLKMKKFFFNLSDKSKMPFHEIKWNFSFRLPGNIAEYIDNYFNSKNYYSQLTGDRDEILQHISYVKTDGNTFEYDCDTSGELNSERVIINYDSDKFDTTLNIGKLSCHEKNVLQNIINCVIDLKKREINEKDIMILFRSRNNLIETLVNQLKALNINIISNFKTNIKEHSGYENFILLLEFFLYPIFEKKMFHVKHDHECKTHEDKMINKFGIKKLLELILKNIFTENIISCDETTEIINEYKSDSTFHVKHKNELFEIIFTLYTYINNYEYKSFFCYLNKLIASNKINLDFNLSCIFSEIFKNLIDIGIKFLPEILLNIKDNDYEISFTVSRETLQNIEENNSIKIMTIHSSKGLESDHVILYDDFSEKIKIFRNSIHFDEHNNLFYFFHKEQSSDSRSAKLSLTHREMEEEKRLLYVAMTRSRKNLYIFR